MPRKPKTKVFVSYSRHDEAIVRPLAGLLGVAAEDAVFMDVEQLKPGDIWEEKLFKALNESSVFVLCWCCKGAQSTSIAKEISTALKDPGKRLVPVLLCSAQLPEELGKREWIDLSKQIRHECTVSHSETKPESSSTRYVGRAMTMDGEYSKAAARAREQRRARGQMTVFKSDTNYSHMHSQSASSWQASSGNGKSVSQKIELLLLVVFLATVAVTLAVPQLRFGLLFNISLGLSALLLCSLLVRLLAYLVRWMFAEISARSQANDANDADMIAKRAREYFHGLSSQR